MPKIKLELEPRKPARAPDADREPAEPVETPLLRAKNFLTGRTGERREKRRTRAPRNMLGRRG